MNFILCADLHLKEEEKKYSLEVLDEVIGLCEKNKCGALLLAGDIFDSWKDIELLRGEFRQRLDGLPSSCTVYFLPGNHEALKAASSESINKFDFGKTRLLDKKPFSLLNLNDEAELLAIPFQSEYSDYRNWGVPQKNKAMRILLAHGSVSGLIYTGPQEDADSTLDEDIFSFLQIDIAAMGHIHKQITAIKGNTAVVYPGSARIWRDGEEGRRCVLLGNTKNTNFTPLYLELAGEYRVITLSASPNGCLSPNIQTILAEIKTQKDWLHLEVCGVVEDENIVMGALKEYEKQLKERCRKLTINSNNDKLFVLSGISSHPLAVSFLKAWEEKKEEYENDIYEAARLQGLLAIKKNMEKKK